MLVGREREIAALREVLDGARGGEGGALVLSGEAGIGKTALLGHAESFCDGFRVIRVAWETTGASPSGLMGVRRQMKFY